MVRTSGNVQPGGQPTAAVAPMHWFQGTADADRRDRSTRRSGSSRRSTSASGASCASSGPQSNQSLDCEPATGGQGHDFQMFATGCDPWYTRQPVRGPAVVVPIPARPGPAPGSCPDKNGILAAAEQPGQQPWQCVVKAPGFSPNVIGDGISAAIGNCANINNNSCQQHALHQPELLRPGRSRTSGRSTGGDAEPARRLPVHRPVRRYKNTGSQDRSPDPQLRRVLRHRLARATTATRRQPVRRARRPRRGRSRTARRAGTDGGEIVGYFVDWTLPSRPGRPQRRVRGRPAPSVRPCTCSLFCR